MRFRFSSAGILGLGLAAALAVIVGLVQLIGELREQSVAMRRRSALPHEGVYVPPVRVATVTGDSVTLGEPVGPNRQLLFVFNTVCPFCKATLPVWETLTDSVRRVDASIEIVGVSLDSASKSARYATEHRLHFPVAVMTEPRWSFLYRARVVPQTVVVEAGGRVRFATVGQLALGASMDSVYRSLARRPEEQRQADR